MPGQKTPSQKAPGRRTSRTRTATTPAAPAASAPDDGHAGEMPAQVPAPAAPAALVPGVPAGSARGAGVGDAHNHRVAAALREQILSGALRPGAPLPAERQLAAEYGVARTTIRAALATLRAEGLVSVLDRRGAFVRPRDLRPTRTVWRGPDAAPGGDDWSPLEPASTYRVDAPPALALALGVAENAPVFGVDRLTADPAGRRHTHRLYLPFAVAADVPALETDPFPTADALPTVLRGAGYHITQTDYILARTPTGDDAATLHIPDATPMLVIRRSTTDTRTGRVLALEETSLSAEDTQIGYPLGTSE